MGIVRNMLNMLSCLSTLKIKLLLVDSCLSSVLRLETPTMLYVQYLVCLICTKTRGVKTQIYGAISICSHSQC